MAQPGDKGEPTGKSSQPMRNQEQVHIRVTFQKIGDIDTVKETFIADVQVEAKWREPSLDGAKSPVDTEKINWKSYWNPRLSVLNFVGEQKEPFSFTVEHSNDEAFVIERRRFNGTFMEQLELQDFPFDTQELQIIVISGLSHNEVVLENDVSTISKLSPQSFADENEWQLNEEVAFRKVHNDVSADIQKPPTLSAYCTVSRRYGFYIWNIMFVMFLISCMSFVTWSVAVTKPENRIQLTFILLLTTVTFKFAVNSSLPRISYLTYLDIYIITNMVFMVAVSIWHGLSITCQLSYEGKLPTDVNIYFSVPDKIALIVLAVVFVVVNVVFAVVIVYRLKRSKKKPCMKCGNKVEGECAIADSNGDAKGSIP